MMACGRGFDSPQLHQSLNPDSSELGVFFVCSRVPPRVRAGSCGNLRTSPSLPPSRFFAHFSLSGPFLSVPSDSDEGRSPQDGRPRPNKIKGLRVDESTGFFSTLVGDGVEYRADVRSRQNIMKPTNSPEAVLSGPEGDEFGTVAVGATHRGVFLGPSG